jgi:hypothetical protein
MSQTPATVLVIQFLIKEPDQPLADAVAEVLPLEPFQETLLPFEPPGADALVPATSTPFSYQRAKPNYINNLLAIPATASEISALLSIFYSY